MKNLEEMCEKYGLAGLNVVIGAVTGTIDVLTTGMPIFSLFLPAYNFIAYAGSLDYVDQDLVKEGLCNWSAHLLGVSIPFVIKNNDIIMDYLKQYVENLS